MEKLKLCFAIASFVGLLMGCHDSNGDKGPANAIPQNDNKNILSDPNSYSSFSYLVKIPTSGYIPGESLFSPSGDKLLLPTDSYGDASVFSVNPWQRKTSIKVNYAYDELVFSEDGQYVFQSNTGTTIQKIDISTNQVENLSIPNQKFERLAFSQNGSRVSVAVGNGLLKVYDLKNQALIREITVDAPEIMRIEMSGNGKVVALAVGQKSDSEADIEVFNLDSGKLIYRGLEKVFVGEAMKLSFDGTLLAFTKKNCDDIVYDLTNAHEFKLEYDENDCATSYEFSTNKLLLAVSRPFSKRTNGVIVYELSRPAVTGLMYSHFFASNQNSDGSYSSPRFASFSPNGEMLVIASHKGTTLGGAEFDVWKIRSDNSTAAH